MYKNLTEELIAIMSGRNILQVAQDLIEHTRGSCDHMFEVKDQLKVLEHYIHPENWKSTGNTNDVYDNAVYILIRNAIFEVKERLGLFNE